MSAKFDFEEEQYELSCETTGDSSLEICTSNDEAEDGPSSHLLSGRNTPAESQASYWQYFTSLIPRRYRRTPNSPRRRTRRSKIKPHRTCSPRSLLRKSALFAYVFLSAVTAIVIFESVFYPSYTHRPKHYQELRSRVYSSVEDGRGNPHNEKVFIAASIYDEDGKLAGGRWAKNVLDLIYLLGPDNTYLSIYENDGGMEAKNALTMLKQKVPCNHTLTFEDHLPLDEVPHITLPDGARRVKRIAYLAAVRNKALKPLEEAPIKYDKLLYLNDIFFNPVDIVQLLFSTNADKTTGKANYRAACAVDFINPFKFYDTFATRDSEGYRMGVIFFPWFSPGGEAKSRQQVLDGTDAVQVKSCWGGITAFDAKYFQPSDTIYETAGSEGPLNITNPVRFRAENDIYWDASECCLIHADIQSTDPHNTGIYMNPFIRVAYGTKTLSWLGFTRRFERLYSPIQFLIDVVVGNPSFNERQHEHAWEQTEETIWVSDPSSPAGGSFEHVPRLATHAGFCGRRKLPVMKIHRKPGERPWEFLPIPTQ
jgi:hypothetical protein